MRGIQVNAVRFRQIRLARQFTQQQLAKLAGVSERTVRNAEAGRRVRLDFLGYLSSVLAVEVQEIVLDSDELRTAQLEQTRAGHIMAAINAIVNERDFSELFSLVSKDVIISVPGPKSVPFCGDYRGVDGMRTLGDRSLESIEYERATEFTEIRSSGKLVVVTGRDWFHAISTGKSISPWWQHIYEFDKGRIVRIDDWTDATVLDEAFRHG